MRRRLIVCSLALVSFFASEAAAASKADLAKSVFQRALQNSAVLHWTEMHPHRISSDFRYLGKESAVTGTFVADLVSAKQWRDRVQAGDYVQFRVRNNEKMWRGASAEFMPMRIYQFSEALHPSIHPLSKNDTINDYFKKTLNGRDLECAQVQIFGSSIDRHDHQIVCVEAESGALAIFETQEFSIVYAGLQKLDDWMMPTKVQVAEEGKPVAAGVIRIEAAPELTEADFVQPPNGTEEPICQDFQEPFVRKDPEFFFNGSMSHIVNGRVTVWMKLDAKGKITKTFIAETGNKDMNGILLEMVHRAIFDPARCDGKPVPSEYHATMVFIAN
jgi:hypothetical protein